MSIIQQVKYLHITVYSTNHSAIHTTWTLKTYRHRMWPTMIANALNINYYIHGLQLVLHYSIQQHWTLKYIINIDLTSIKWLQALRDCPPLSAGSLHTGLRYRQSASTNQLVVPRHHRTQFGRRAFSVAGPMAWNALPDSIRDTALSTCSFRRYLKTLLFSFY